MTVHICCMDCGNLRRLGPSCWLTVHVCFMDYTATHQAAQEVQLVRGVQVLRRSTSAVTKVVRKQVRTSNNGPISVGFLSSARAPRPYKQALAKNT